VISAKHVPNWYLNESFRYSDSRLASKLMKEHLSMDPTSHISSVKLFHYLIDAIPLNDDERHHLDHCSYCQSVVEEYKKYISPAMIRAA